MTTKGSNAGVTGRRGRRSLRGVVFRVAFCKEFRMRWQGFMAGALAACFASSAMAGVLEERFRAGDTCYARAYDKAHLRKHPKQRVREILLTNLQGETGEDTSAWDVVLDFGFTLTDGEDYSAVAYCKNDHCSIEGDGGRFDVVAAKDGGLRLSIVGNFLELEGATGFSGNLAKSDDKVFLIYPVNVRGCDLS